MSLKVFVIKYYSELSKDLYLDMSNFKPETML